MASAIVHYRSSKTASSPYCCYKPWAPSMAWTSEQDRVTCKKCLEQLKKDKRNG